MRQSTRTEKLKGFFTGTTLLVFGFAPVVTWLQGPENSKDKAGIKASSNMSAPAVATVSAIVETAPVPHPEDAADDPAIWINPLDPSRSTIIGTDKQGGLGVYDLDGKEIQYVPAGRVDNVDIRSGFPLSGQAVDVVTASNRTNNTIAIYKVNPSTRMLEEAAARPIETVLAYGACMYRSAKTNKYYYFVTSKTGVVEQWELFDNNKGKIDARKARSFKVGGKIEGCVADDELDYFYVSEEVLGIWKYGAEPDAGEDRAIVDRAGGGGPLVADIEGLAIAYGKNGTGYLIASSQGDNSFAIYRREGKNEFVKSFRIVAGKQTDGVEETDGIDVTTLNLGPRFPSGLFVAQDGINDNGNQNFKLVPWNTIIEDR